MDTPFYLRLVSAAGLVVLLLLAWLMSTNRRAIPWRVVVWGLGLQFLLAILILKTPFGMPFFDLAREAFDVLTNAATEGARFVFGNLPVNFEIGAIVAFQVLPVIIFVSSLAAVLQHIHVIQAVIRAIAYVMQRTMRTSGVETFSAALQVFCGIESLAAVRGYFDNMTRSELFTIMTTFMASIAASVMVAYASFGASPGHLLAASLMSAPAALVIAKLMIPETGVPQTSSAARLDIPIESHNLVDAAARGAADGLNLALNVGAMLIAFIGMVYLIDLVVRACTGHTFPQLVGWLFYPFAFLMGVPVHDVPAFAQLLGKKTVLNEFLAYADFKTLKDTLSPRTITIATYALCGFANPGSLGILIGATTNLMPTRRQEIVSLGIKSLIAGTLSTFTTACVAGILL